MGLILGSACSKNSTKSKVISDPSKADHQYVPIPKDTGVKIDPATDSDPNQE